MNDFKVVKYSASHYLEWNAFVSHSKNGTFLFHRDFMEYHNDRFEDFSLMVYKNDKLTAILPANISNSTIYSHQGLSYGGVLVLKNINIKTYTDVFSSIFNYLKKQNFKSFIIKKMPFIYNKKLSGELDFVLSKVTYKTTTDSYFVIDDLQNYKPNRNRSRAIKKANQKNATISNVGIDFFWQHILTKNLNKKFNVNPVHSIQEIKLLMKRFPDNIKFYSVQIADAIEAGVVMFISDNVAHFQYSSGGEHRAETGALDFLFHEIITKYSHKEYISFGSSSTDKTLRIEPGLAYWKESFGATIITQDFYEIELNNMTKLDAIFI